MNFKKRINGSWVDTPNYIHNTSTDTITTLPAVVYANGTTATVGLKGQTVQSSIPSPTSPVMPEGTGERTGNLFDESTLLNGYYDTTSYQYYPNNNYRCFPLLLPAGTYTIFAKSDVLTIRLLRVSSASLGANAINLDNQSYTFTLPTTETIYVSLRNITTTNDFTGLTIMLNTGSSSLPHEPYGYEIPISSANTTTPVYLGEVETTRKIRQLVLTGNETVAGSTVTGGWIITNLSDNINNLVGVQTVYCSHYLAKNNGAMSSLSQGEMCISTQVNNRINFVTNFATAEDFKAYLAQQYAAGTPVTVWYVLATEETGIVNEPIRKIGDYADSISGITIPTIAGADSFDVLTTPKPSEVSLSYTGWHDATVEEWDGSQWQ